MKSRQQTGGEWRHRHKVAYYVAIGLTSVFDFVFAAFV